MRSLLSVLGSRGDPSIAVAVLDGRIDTGHPCFTGATIEEPLGVGAAPDLASPDVVHGTHVASILFGQSDASVLGIVPRCRGISVPIFEGSARHCSQVDLARGILLAVEHGA